MYEKRCAVIVVDERANGDATKSPEVYETAATPKMEAVASPIMSRRHSTDVAPNLLPSLSRTSKLTMRDFLIMPIQRICRYPLMLRQLQLNAGLATPPASPTLTASVGAHTNPADAGIEAQALDAMKQVAAKVDEARRRTDIAIKTRLVIERISEQVRDDTVYNFRWTDIIRTGHATAQPIGRLLASGFFGCRISSRDTGSFGSTHQSEISRRVFVRWLDSVGQSPQKQGL